MNQKKAKALRKMLRQQLAPKNLPERVMREMGSNIRMVDGRPHKITSTLTNADDTMRGQYRAYKRMISAAYGGK